MKRFATAMAVALLLAACSGDDGTTADDGTAAEQEAPDEGAADDSAADDADEPSEPADEPDEGGGDDGAAPPEPGGEVNGSATVTIDGVAYEFATTGFVAEVCNPDQFGIFFGVMQRVDDGGAAMDGGLLEAILVRDETAAAEIGQAESITVTTGEGDLVWIADAEQVEERDQLDAGQSQVDSTELTDTTASGTATFYSEESLFEVAGGLADTVTTADGTFEINCVAG